MKNFGLLGYPLGHSLSPIIHKELFKISNTDADYKLYQVSEDSFNTKIPEMLQTLSGFNVTIPYKKKIISNLNNINDRAALYGAVNTVKIENGKSTGYNTDCFGFLRSLESANINIDGDVLICGAGGVGAMFAFECAIAGANVTIGARNKIKAQLLADEIAKKVGKSVNVTTFEQICDKYSLIVNGTPVGMFPNINHCVLTENVIKQSDAVFDAIYNPSETKLIKTAKKHNIKCLNGLPMLVWQAAVAQEIWNDVSFSEDQIKEVINITERKSGTI